MDTRAGVIVICNSNCNSNDYRILSNSNCNSNRVIVNRK